jgi:hypothetical protein
MWHSVVAVVEFQEGVRSVTGAFSGALNGALNGALSGALGDGAVFWGVGATVLLLPPPLFLSVHSVV